MAEVDVLAHPQRAAADPYLDQLLSVVTAADREDDAAQGSVDVGGRRPPCEWQASGALFEIVRLDVTAGADVAFAHALLRCRTPDEFESDPARRLRLTIGLCKEAGRWVVAHEHHSFTDRS